MNLIAYIENAAVIERILTHLERGAAGQRAPPPATPSETAAMSQKAESMSAPTITKPWRHSQADRQNAPIPYSDIAHAP